MTRGLYGGSKPGRGISDRDAHRSKRSSRPKCIDCKDNPSRSVASDLCEACINKRVVAAGEVQVQLKVVCHG